LEWFLSSGLVIHHGSRAIFGDVVLVKKFFLLVVRKFCKSFFTGDTVLAQKRLSLQTLVFSEAGA
jgi:hypothetical protein